MSGDHKFIAVFGDTHGHLRLMFQLCRLWQKNNGRHLDGILQCGDLGFFPDVTRLDKATKKFARKDHEELGFAEYFRLPQPMQVDPLLHQTLEGDPESLDTVRCDVVFCHGNHEDFEALESVTSGSACSSVDAFNRLHFLRSGETTQIAGIQIGAIGGAPESESTADEILGKHVSKRAVNRLRKHEFEVLLTHGSAYGSGGESDRWGSKLIRELIEATQPAVHFYAHHSDRIPPTDIRATRSVWLNDTNFETTKDGRHLGPVEPGCMALLQSRSPTTFELELIDQEWFRQVTGITWRHY